MYSTVTVLIMAKGWGGGEGGRLSDFNDKKDKVNLYYSYTTWLSYSA